MLKVKMRGHQLHQNARKLTRHLQKKQKINLLTHNSLK